MPTRLPLLLALALLPLLAGAQATAPLHSHVDPLIGSTNYGHVFVGPSRPFGMIKPGPDNDLTANSGHTADFKQPLHGFSQVHVSGTGGGPKYGNVRVMPFAGPANGLAQRATMQDEKVALGYYAVTHREDAIRTEITTAHKTAFYRFRYAKPGPRGVKLDAGALLNDRGLEAPADKAYLVEEAQQLVGSEIEVISDRELRGHNRVRGGWNSGGPYTVYFHAVFDQPFKQFQTWRGEKLMPGVRHQPDQGGKTGALLQFDAAPGAALQMKIAISYLSSARAKQNLDDEIPGWRFEQVLADTQTAWERQLSRIEIGADASPAQRRMFYTGLYHAQLMPVDRSGENPLWQSGKPYYDDFYAIWDTFRSSHPLLTLIDPKRQADIVNSLIDIQQHDGFMPDARSGNSNGRTQGGSNADVLIADAFVKQLPGIDYAAALQAMLTNADVPPGGNEEKEGRGGLADYNRLGYVSASFPRSGTRTVEYAYNDFAIAVVAKGLGRQDVYERFAAQANGWQKLWRDVESDGSRGFIMPRNADGSWMEKLQCTVKNAPAASRVYKPTDHDYGQCVCWWCSFLYEGSSWEYSLYAPHDVAGLIGKSGGPAAFQRRLDTLFERKHFNVSNEPSFLSPTLYHWIGKPELSSARIRSIVDTSFGDGPGGLPGNDDSGAMSSWLAFHMLGLYPNAGQSYYLINTPFTRDAVIHLASGRSFRIKAPQLSAAHRTIVGAKLNGQPYRRAWIEHRDIEAGGVLELELGPQPADWGRDELPPSLRFH